METNVLIIKNESLERFLIENFNVDAREIRGCTSYYHLMKNEIALKKSDMLKLDDNIEFHMEGRSPDGNFHVEYIYSYIIRKSKFPPNPERSVQFSGKRTKRSVQKIGCTQHL